MSENGFKKITKVPDYKLPVSNESPSGGVKVFSIEGRFKNVRDRLSGEFTDADRAWRKQWLKDQVLSHNEPRVVPELQKELYNPVRRFYRKPWDVIGSKLAPVVGDLPAMYIRHITPKIMMGLVIVYMGAYYMKYNKNNWTKAHFWRRSENGPRCLPGEPGYPNPPRAKINPQDYYDQGFKSRKVFLD